MWLWIILISIFAGLLYMVRKIENQPRETRIPVPVKINRYR